MTRTTRQVHGCLLPGACAARLSTSIINAAALLGAAPLIAFLLFQQQFVQSFMG